MKRSAALILAIVATGLTIFGVVVAATDPNPSGVATDPLALNGYPPTSANLSVTVSSSQSFDVTATVAVNFQEATAEAQVNLPAEFTAASIDARLVDGQLYLRSADVTSGSWQSTPVKVPTLFGLSLELVRPDLNLISGFSETKSTNGYATTYVFTKHDVAVSNIATTSTSKVGEVVWSITVGKQGEVTGSNLVVSTKHDTTTVNVQVLSYNQPVHVEAPPANQVQVMTPATRREFLRPLRSLSFVVPQSLTHLGQVSLK